MSTNPDGIVDFNGRSAFNNGYNNQFNNQYNNGAVYNNAGFDNLSYGYGNAPLFDPYWGGGYWDPYYDNFIARTVSYTHLTLPTTPYV